MALVQKAIPLPGTLSVPAATSRRAVPQGLTPEDEATNLRVWKMWDEARSFETELTRFQNDLMEFASASNDFLGSIEPLMLAPLPRVWDHVEGGLAEPIRATISHGHPHTVGGDASLAALREARVELEERVTRDVMRPLDQWHAALALVEERLPELDKLRKKVGKRSATIDKLHSSSLPTSATFRKHQRSKKGGGGVGGMFAKMCGSGGGTRVRGDDSSDYSSSDEEGRGEYLDQYSRVQTAREDREIKRAYRARRLEASRQDYVHLEGLIASQLSGLVRDAAWLKSYMVSSLLLTKEAMQIGVIAMGNTKQPLPAFYAPRCGLSPTDSHGAMRDNLRLAAAMPEGLDLSSVHVGLNPSGGTLLPAELHATMATAQPMELAARPDVSALERVSTAPVGAAAVPASAVEGVQLQEQRLVMDSNVGGAHSAGMGGTGASMEGGMRSGMGMGGGVEVAHRSSPVGVTTPVGGARGLVTPGAMADGHMGQVERRHNGRRGLHRGGHSSSSSSSSSSSDEEGMMTGRRGTVGGVRSTVAAGGAHRGVIGTTAGAGVAAVGEEEVCGRKYFTEVEDRPVVKEQRTRYIEHHPVQKEFVTEVKYVGEQEVHAGKSVDQVDSRVRTVAVTQPKSPCETIGGTGSDTCNMMPAAGGGVGVQGTPGASCGCGKAGCTGCASGSGGCSCGVAGCPGCGAKARPGVTPAPAGELVGV